MTKKTLTLKIQAETVELTETSLRVNGKIKEGPEDIPKDSYQAISLEEGKELILEKEKWLDYHQQKIAEACEKKYSYLICLFDREEALFALTKKFGYEMLNEIKGEVAKKSQDVEIKKDFQQEIIKDLETYDSRFHPENIILASPAFYKEDLFKKISSHDLKKKIVLAVCSDISARSIYEVMRRPELDKILKNSRVREEQLLIEELLNEINKNEKAAYGWRQVKEAADSGAVAKLILTEDFIRKKRLDDEFDEVDLCMKNVDALKGEIHLISSAADPGKKLDGLGGVAAVLRYKLWN